MDIETFRTLALSLPFVTERMPYGPDCLALEIGGKQFALLCLSDGYDFYNIKVEPEYSESLRERYASIRPGWHMNKRHWISVDYHGDVPEIMHYGLIVRAYMCTLSTLPKIRQSELKAPLPDVLLKAYESLE